MKLNKVLALALSGVMAVSMLAGCKGATPDNGDQEQTPVTSNAVAVMNDAQKVVEFKADGNFDSALAAAKEKASYANVSKAKLSATLVTDSDTVWKELDKKLPVGELLDNTAISFEKNSGVKVGSVNTQTALYVIESDGFNEDAALKLVAATLKDAAYPEFIQIGTAGTYYAATYEGNVSVASVSETDAGKTESAYYIAISVTQTVGRDQVYYNPNT